MSWSPPGTWSVLRLLAWTSVLRLLRAARIARSRRLRSAAPRQATARKRSDGFTLLMLAMLPVFLFQAMVVTSQATDRLVQRAQAEGDGRSLLLVRPWVLHIIERLDRTASEAEIATQLAVVGEEDRPSRAEVVAQFLRLGPSGFASRTPEVFLLVDPARWRSPVASRTFAGCGAVILLVLLLLLVTMGIGGANVGLAGGEWTFAWLMTFPVATRGLVLAKVLEYSLVQLFTWLTGFPLLWQLLRAADLPGAMAIAAAATLGLAVITGALRFWGETWLRLHCSLQQLRSVQGVCSLLTLLLLAGLFAVCLGRETPAWFVAVGRAAPEWLGMLPAAWPMALADRPLQALTGIVATLAIAVAACLGSVRLLRHGTMRSAGVDPGVRDKSGQWARGTRRLGVLGKDLSRLLRDRNFLVQTLVVPLCMIGMQLFINQDLGAVRGRGAVLVAYGIGVYSLIGGCFQVLSGEGRALWILYTLPVTVADVLRRKTRLWAAFAVVFALTALAAFALRSGSADPLQRILDVAFVACGVFGAAHLAAGISILGTEPAADHVPRQPKVGHVYLYFFFAGSYMAGLQSAELTTRLAALLVFATLAFAVWQRACDRLPWLLDPVDEDRSRIGLYDGAAAAMVFFVLQAVVLLIARGGGEGRSGLLPVALAFAVAGLVTGVLFLVMLARRGVPVGAALGLRAPDGMHVVQRLGLGILAGLVAGAVGIGYLKLVRAQGWFDLPAPVLDGGDRILLVLLTVVAAPLCEELIFRGLVFQGLARTVRVPLALVWSSGLFMAVHPLPSWAPVGLMGLAAGLVLHRTRYLPAAMLTHAVYNAMVVLLGP